MKPAVACSGLLLLTCTAPPVEREQPPEIAAAPIADLPTPPPSRDATEDTTADVPADMPEAPYPLAPTRPPPCTRWPSVATLCDCLERHHREALGAGRTECRRSIDSGQAAMRVFQAVVDGGEPGGTVCYLAERRAGGAAVFFAGPPVDSRPDCEFPGGYRRPLTGGREVVHVRFAWTTRRSLPGECTTNTTTTSTDALLCVREPGSLSTTVCDLRVPVAREVVTDVVCDDPKRSKTSRRSARFDVRVDADGNVSTELLEGDRRWLARTPDAAWIAPRKLSLRRPKP